MKRLGEKDLKHVQMQLESGKTQIEVARELTEEGYVNRRGTPIKAADVGNFLRSFTSSVRLDGRKSKSVVSDVQALMNSDLPPKLKEKFLRVLMAES